MKLQISHPRSGPALAFGEDVKQALCKAWGTGDPKLVLESCSTSESGVRLNFVPHGTWGVIKQNGSRVISAVNQGRGYPYRVVMNLGGNSDMKSPRARLLSKIPNFAPVVVEASIASDVPRLSICVAPSLLKAPLSQTRPKRPRPSTPEAVAGSHAKTAKSTSILVRPTPRLEDRIMVLMSLGGVELEFHLPMKLAFQTAVEWSSQGYKQP